MPYTMTDLRTWCEQAGITGTDLNTALAAWGKSRGVNDSDGIRVQRVLEHHLATHPESR